MEIREPYSAPVTQVVGMEPGSCVLQASLDMSWDVANLDKENPA